MRDFLKLPGNDSMTLGLYEPNASTQLPNELCREIIENLHYLKDRRTLLRLALVSKAWCAESQRVLFRTACDDFVDPDKHESLIHTHILFLESIIFDPTRLGSYVQTYNQRRLVYHPWSGIPRLPAASYLWDLTAKALPTLVNLKHLVIAPSFDNPIHPRPRFLEGCTFTLETFRWGFEVATSRNSTDLFVKFLRTQKNLLHLEVGFPPQKQDLSWLPDDVCPNLISVSCRLDCAPPVMAKRTNIVALTTSPRRALRTHQLGLHRLKYLDIVSSFESLSNWEAIDSDPPLILLQLTSWHIRTVPSLSKLSNLRVLALFRVPRQDPPSKVLGRGPVDVTLEESIRMELTIKSFQQCPSLEYVVIEDIHRGQGPRRFRKLTLSGPNGSLENETVKSKEFLIDHEPGTPWWTVYGV